MWHIRILQDGRISRCYGLRDGEKCEVFDRIDNNFVWMMGGCCVCVVARCCVRVMHDSLSRSSQASSWLEHQDDFA